VAALPSALRRTSAQWTSRIDGAFQELRCLVLVDGCGRCQSERPLGERLVCIDLVDAVRTGVAERRVSEMLDILDGSGLP